MLRWFLLINVLTSWTVFQLSSFASSHGLCAGGGGPLRGGHAQGSQAPILAPGSQDATSFSGYHWYPLQAVSVSCLSSFTSLSLWTLYGSFPLPVFSLEIPHWTHRPRAQGVCNLDFPDRSVSASGWWGWWLSDLHWLLSPLGFEKEREAVLLVTYVLRNIKPW